MADDPSSLAELNITVNDADALAVAARMQQVYGALYSETIKPLEEELLALANQGIAAANQELERLGANAKATAAQAAALADTSTMFSRVFTEAVISQKDYSDKFGDLNAQVVGLNAQLAQAVVESEELSKTLLPALTGGPVLAEMAQYQTSVESLDVILEENAATMAKDAQAAADYAQAVKPLVAELESLAAASGDVDKALNTVASGMRRAADPQEQAIIEAMKARRIAQNQIKPTFVDEMGGLTASEMLAQQTGMTYEQMMKGGGGGGGTGAGGGFGGQRGSLFGVGHALSVAGFMTGAPGLREAGAAVYIEEGFKRVIPLFNQLNANLGGTERVILPLIGSVSSVGLAFGSLAAAGVILVGGIKAIELSYQGLTDAYEQGKTQLEAYYKALAGGTTESLNKQLAKARSEQEINAEQLADAQRRLGGYAAQFDSTDKLGGLLHFAAALTGLYGPEMKDAYTNVDTLTKKQRELDATVNGVTAATKNEHIAANDLAAAITQNADAQVKAAKRYAEDDQMTTDAANKRLQMLVQDRAYEEDLLAAAQKAYTVKGQTLAQYDAENEAIQKHSEAIRNDTGEIIHITTESLQLIKAREDEAAAIQAQQKALEAKMKAMDTEVAEADKRAQLMRSATPEQVGNLIQDTRDHILNLKNELSKFAEIDLKTAPKEVVDEWQHLQDELLKAQQDLDFYNNTLMEQARANEAAAQAIKDYNQTVQDQAQAYENYQDKQAQIEAEAVKKRLEINQDFQNALIKAAEDAGQAAKRALEKMNEADAEAAQKLGDDQAKAVRGARDKYDDIMLKAQRDEVDKLQAHLQKLQDIKNSDWLADQKALLDRNYTQLLSNSLGRTQAMQDEQKHYDQERAKRSQALSDSLTDYQTQLGREARERQIAYQNKLRDDQQQYKREVEQAQAKYTAEINLAQQESTNALDQLRAQKQAEQALNEQNFLKEMDLAAKTAFQRQQALIEEAGLALQLQRLIRGITLGASLPATEKVPGRNVHGAFAAGGYLNAGDTVLVNEPGSSGMESFNGTMFPGGMGLFTALRSGYVDSGRSGGASRGGANITIHVQAHDTEGVKREIVTFMEGYFR